MKEGVRIEGPQITTRYGSFNFLFHAFIIPSEPEVREATTPFSSQSAGFLDVAGPVFPSRGPQSWSRDPKLPAADRHFSVQTAPGVERQPDANAGPSCWG